MMSVDSSEPIEVFYSYAQADEVLRDELEKHLVASERLGLIRNWHNQDVPIGTDWMQAVDAHLDSAHIILLLVSPDFMDSDRCYKVEMERALERQKEGVARVIPILLRPVDLRGTPIASLRPLPTNGRPIARWYDRDAAFMDVSNGVREVINEFNTKRNDQNLDRTFDTDETARNVASYSSTIPKYRELTNRSARVERIGEMTTYETIDTHEAIRIFHEIMQVDAQKRILCLVGDGKMGKTHLLTRVLSPLAERDYQARSALLDLGYPLSTVPDILSQMCAQLGDQYFHAYYEAEQGWMSRPRVDVKGLTATFSHVTVANKDHHDEAHYQARYLTSQFIRSINQLTDRPLLFLFDNVEKASEEMLLWWLMKILLLSTSRLKHVRVVLAGRSLPDLDGSYRALCLSHRLLPVAQIDEYITYCQQSNLALSEDAIRALAHAFDYTPGLFVDVLHKFTAQKGIHG